MAEDHALGTPSNQDAWKKCYLDQQHLNSTTPAKQTLIAATTAAPVSASSSPSSPPSAVSQAEAAATTAANRCAGCRKRVGLTGFGCRCGLTYCGVHRYPEKHGCVFDYKKMGREQIERQNPVVVAEKLQKI